MSSQIIDLFIDVLGNNNTVIQASCGFMSNWDFIFLRSVAYFQTKSPYRWVEHALYQVMDHSDLIFTNIVFVYRLCIEFQTEL